MNTTNTHRKPNLCNTFFHSFFLCDFLRQLKLNGLNWLRYFHIDQTGKMLPWQMSNTIACSIPIALVRVNYYSDICRMALNHLARDKRRAFVGNYCQWLR